MYYYMDNLNFQPISLFSQPEHTDTLELKCFKGLRTILHEQCV